MKNKKSIKVSEEFYEFIIKMGANRVRIGMEDQTLPICEIPDIILKYNKLNNDRYLELINMEYNGDK
jgi:hypothetical protein